MHKIISLNTITKQYIKTIINFSLLAILLLSNNLVANAKTFHLSLSESRVQSTLVGKWKVKTKVTWSDCPYVQKGNKTTSQFFISEVNGRLYPHWDANNWELVKNNSINFYGDHFTWERENKLIQNSHYWFVRSLDKFELAGRNKLKAKSLIKQYKDGKFVGSYVTESTLVKA